MIFINKLTFMFLFFVISIQAIGQIEMESPYYPVSSDEQGSWKYKGTLFWNEDINSNAFTNDFVKAVDKSQFLDGELIDGQLQNFDGKVLTGQIRNVGGRVYLNSTKKPGAKYYFFGIEHHHILDSSIDEELAALFLKGNKHYTGKTMEAPDSRYYNIYYNQISGGMGFNFDKGDVKQQLQWGLSLNLGQNYDYLGLENSTFYTDPEGEFLDITVSAETKLSDTVWAEFYEVKGIGMSGELLYSYKKSKDFHFDVSIRNLGFVNWNANTFSGVIDTSFVFQGLVVDTIESDNGSFPTDYDLKSLRRWLFPNAETGSFSTATPFSIGLSGGKFFSDGKFYAGIKAKYYPLLKAPVMLEFFGTYNHKNIFFLTPVFLYSSYKKLNYGLSIGVNISDNIRFDVGSAYLNSMFTGSSLAGQGGFVRLGFRF